VLKTYGKVEGTPLSSKVVLWCASGVAINFLHFFFTFHFCNAGKKTFYSSIIKQIRLQTH